MTWRSWQGFGATLRFVVAAGFAMAAASCASRREVKMCEASELLVPGTVSCLLTGKSLPMAERNVVSIRSPVFTSGALEDGTNGHFLLNGQPFEVVAILIDESGERLKFAYMGHGQSKLALVYRDQLDRPRRLLRFEVRTVPPVRIDSVTWETADL